MCIKLKCSLKLPSSVYITDCNVFIGLKHRTHQRSERVATLTAQLILLMVTETELYATATAAAATLLPPLLPPLTPFSPIPLPLSLIIQETHQEMRQRT